jgi:hypothetical protein
MLDPGKAVEDGPADATLAESPEDGPGPVDPDASGPVDRTLPYAATFALAAFGLFAVFAIVALGSTVDASWIWVLLCSSRRTPVGSPGEWLQALPPTVRKQLNLAPC